MVIVCMQAVSIVGDRKMNRWSSIAEMVHGRSQTQCRERWCNVLDPTVKTGTWPGPPGGRIAVTLHAPLRL